MTCYGLANVIGSTLTKATACWLPLCCGYEISVPATKTFTNQVIAFLYLAYRLGGQGHSGAGADPRADGADAEPDGRADAGAGGGDQRLERPVLPGVSGPPSHSRWRAL